MNFFNRPFSMKNVSATNGGDRKLSTESRFGSLLLGTIALLVSANTAVAQPNMFLNQTEINAIKLKIDAGAQPWTGAYTQVLANASTALTQAPLSVTFGGATTNNQYSTEHPFCGWTAIDGDAPDCRDGHINDQQNRFDYESAIQLGDTVRDLGLAYAFSDDPTQKAEYADKAISLINTWTLGDTRMTPNAAIRSIEVYITMPGLFYGADLISDYSGWDATQKSGFQGWAQAFGDDVQNRGEGANNHANWRVVMLASAGALLNDADMLADAETEWKSLIRSQMNGVGSNVAGALGQETGRPQGLHYSLYTLNAMIQGAEILRHQGVNVYDYVGPSDNNGQDASLKLALDYIVGFASAEDPVAAFEAARGLVDNGHLGYTQITEITADNSMALFELAYSYYGDPNDPNDPYLAVLERWGRPIDEIRIMGINTLTHGNTFDLDLTAPGLDGDFDLDEDVDGADFLRWQRDGLSGSALADWEANFGTTAPLATASTSVPEPAAGLMLLVGCGLCTMQRRRRATPGGSSYGH